MSMNHAAYNQRNWMVASPFLFVVGPLARYLACGCVAEEKDFNRPPRLALHLVADGVLGAFVYTR